MRGFLLLIVLTTGCFANGGTDCLGESPDLLFDPQRGQCIYVGSAEGCQCVAGPASPACFVGDPHERDLAACHACGTKTEAECIAHADCIAQYINGSYADCRGAPPSGSVHAGACVGLDARECSRRDYCALRYTRADEHAPAFEGCADEVAASQLASGGVVDPDDVFHR